MKMLKCISIGIVPLVIMLIACSQEELGPRTSDPEGTEVIAFLRDRSQIYVMNADGSHVRLLGSGKNLENLLWSPDGTSLTYKATPRDFFDSRIHIMNAAGVINKPMEEWIDPQSFTLSPDGKYIAFDSQHESFDGRLRYRIYITPIDSPVITGILPLVDTVNSLPDTLHLWDAHPSWSPDGTQIAFSSDRAGGRQIYTMGTDGSRLTRLTESPIRKVWPVWSPDGKKIAFVGYNDRNNSSNIYVMDADGGEIFQVTHNLFFSSEHVAWSPDGTWIAFSSNHDGNVEIYVINIDGTGLKRLTSHPGVDFGPTWSPGPLAWTY